MQESSPVTTLNSAAGRQPWLCGTLEVQHLGSHCTTQPRPREDPQGCSQETPGVDFLAGSSVCKV